MTRILLWHGYLLGGSGSNVYTRALAREWSLAGHDVTVVCQEPTPKLYDLGRATVIRPELPNDLLPVFVLDNYPGLKARLLQDFSQEQLRRYVDANADALRALLPADLVFANHVLMGGPVAAATGCRFRIKVHGSELEYSMRGRSWLENWSHESLRSAEVVFVGSQHVRKVLEEVVGYINQVVEGPPGVNIDQFVRQDRGRALHNLIKEAKLDPPNPKNANEWLPDEGNAKRFATFFKTDKPMIIYFGKLIRNKGVQLLLEALSSLDARAVIVGFGDYRADLERLASRLPHQQILFTGHLEHRHLVHLLPLCDAAVVPSIFPEAFGMVAVEAAASGCPPLVARHSGLAEIATTLEKAYPKHLRHLTSFKSGDSTDLREKLAELLALSAKDRELIQSAGRRVVETHYSWTILAKRLLAPIT
ncbi:hypothetical protein A3F65_01080 [Candidatus Saccharibacteria bacterium RIFCSPHIGHO2_12_FULL_47_16b]|nr:MAG: hypothetical protein A3F65_01080 [Candidatus Saccharibacteria bacterium RIFCSPHIGHO2_12_FULL_47_16b]